MIKFLKTAAPGYVPPHRTTIDKYNKMEYIKYRNKLKKFFETVDYISLTTDLWKNRNGSNYICLTCFFIDSNFELVSLTLAFRRFYGRHFSNRIESFILKEINILNMNTNFVGITTDNAADKKAATSNITQRFSCFAHNLNLVF